VSGHRWRVAGMQLPRRVAAGLGLLYCFIDIRSSLLALNGRHGNAVLEAAAAVGQSNSSIRIRRHVVAVTSLIC